MKKQLLSILFTFVILCAINAYAGFYEYSFLGAPGNVCHTTASGGNTAFLLKMSVWINETNTITAKIEKKDGSLFESGSIYIQTDTNSYYPEGQIDCKDNHSVQDAFSKTLSSIHTLDDIPAKWSDDNIQIYARFVDGDTYAWTGPVVIKRNVSATFGSLQVQINSSKANDAGARWRYEIPDSDNKWSSWYKSGVKVDGLNVGETTIAFNDIPGGWLTPQPKKVVIYNGQLTRSKGTYILQSQSILGITLPQQATQAGAKWAAIYDGHGESVFYPGNESRDGFNIGETTVFFKSIEGWDTPESQTVTVRADQPAIVTGVYCKHVPYAPETINVSEGYYNDKVVITWAAVSCVDRYDIYRSTENIPTAQDRIAENVQATIYNDMTTEPGREYYYWVRAVNDRHEGDFSQPVIGFSKIAPPTNLVATDGVHTGKVHISWNTVSGATSYRIYRNTDNSMISAGNPIATNIKQTYYDDTSVEPEKKYYYWVKAENAFMTSEFSNGDMGYGRLGIPDFLDATDSLYANQVRVCWQPVEGAIGYDVDPASRKRNRSNRITSQTQTCYWDTTATPGVTYHYRVRAYNLFGKSDWTHLEAGSSKLNKPVIHASKQTYQNKVRISWLTVEGAKEYLIYQTETNEFINPIHIYTVNGNYYDYATDQPHQLYYWVEASNNFCTSLSESDIGYISNNNCQFNILPKDLVVDAVSGAASINITMSEDSSCMWHAESNVDWISIISDPSGTSNGIIEFKASENRSMDSRVGIITVAGEAIIVEQDGIDPTTLTIMKTGNGKILVDGNACELPYMQKVIPGETISLQAVPDENWKFINFSGSVVDTNNPIEMNVFDDANIVANFIQVQYCLNVTVVGNGHVYLDGKESLQECFPKGKVVNLMARTDLDSVYYFTNWSGDIETQNEVTAIAMDSNKEVTALFSGWALDLQAKGKLNDFDKNIITVGVGSEPFVRKAPPSPPRYSTLMRLINNDQYVNVDIQLEGESLYQWILTIDPHGNMGAQEIEQSSVIQWDPAKLSPQGMYQLFKGQDMETATLVIDNMRETKEYTVTGYSEEQVFSLVWKLPNNNPGPPVTILPISIDLHCESENLGGAYKFDTTIGIDQWSKRTPAAPDAPNFSTYMSLLSTGGRKLIVDIRDMGQNQYEWIVILNPAGNNRPFGTEGESVLDWTFSETSYPGRFQLIKLKLIDSEFVHDGVIVDNMMQTKEFRFRGENRNQYLKIIWTQNDIPIEPDCKFTFALEAGWNLVSFPLLPDRNSISQIFPDAEVVYQYNDGQYKEVKRSDSVTTSAGYWVLVPENSEYHIQGQCFTHYSKNLTAGWHLLGCPNTQTLPMVNPANALEVMFEYRDGSYEIVTECTPGYGFWVSMMDEREIVLDMVE